MQLNKINLLIYVSTFQSKIEATKGERIYIKTLLQRHTKEAKVLQIKLKLSRNSITLYDKNSL